MNSIHPVITALRVRFALVFLYIYLAAAWQSAMATSISTQFTLDGYLKAGTPSSFNLADLEAFATANP